MRHVTSTIDIDAPSTVVWDLMTDFDRWPEWGPSVRKVASPAPASLRR